MNTALAEARDPVAMAHGHAAGGRGRSRRPTSPAGCRGAKSRCRPARARACWNSDGPDGSQWSGHRVPPSGVEDPGRGPRADSRSTRRSTGRVADACRAGPPAGPRARRRRAAAADRAGRAARPAGAARVGQRRARSCRTSCDSAPTSSPRSTGCRRTPRSTPAWRWPRTRGGARAARVRERGAPPAQPATALWQPPVLTGSARQRGWRADVFAPRVAGGALAGCVRCRRTPSELLRWNNTRPRLVASAGTAGPRALERRLARSGYRRRAGAVWRRPGHRAEPARGAARLRRGRVHRAGSGAGAAGAVRGPAGRRAGVRRLRGARREEHRSGQRSRDGYWPAT